ncbi:putative LysR family regulatory protein [Zopfia rhizophila CBS 207.26]|uniref:Putative LysR family regulatory protein n=1 Tax=Zopfia rhizophila CBS 207.26 TaxID=1314779 RepID=A0A6A6DTE0_9PEZI|nr:putative LysR family regulatory protein [Zopfia rhizophila CBS 207.26]
MFSKGVTDVVNSHMTKSLLCFDDVLDAEKLREALDNLLQKDGWRKLGARLRRTKDDKLEYHVPAEFSEKRPAFLYTTDKHVMSVADHPVLAKLPRGNGARPAIFEPSSQIFRPHMRASNATQYLQDWLYSDIPQLAIHVVNFNDATILTVTLLHTLTDAMGLAALLRAWTAVLRDEEDQIPPFIEFDAHDDPIETLHQGTPPSQYVLANRLVKGWGLFMFVVRNIFQLLWWPKAEVRNIFVLGEYINKLCQSARTGLAESQNGDGNKDGDHVKPFLSESDVLCSWWTRIVVRALNPSPQRTVCLINLFDSRGVLAELGRVPSADVALMTNAAYPATSLIPAGEVSSTTTPLSSLANQVRNAINTHRTEGQFQAQAAAIRESTEKAGHPPVYGDPDMLLVADTNCHRGKLFQTDFSPAVVAQEGVSLSKHAGNYYKGKPSFVNASSTESRFSTRNPTVIVGKDLAGNWWLMSRLRIGAWKSVEQQIKML